MALKVIFLGDAPALGSDPFLYCPTGLKITYIFGNQSFEGSIVYGKWNGYDVIPLFRITYDANGAESGSVPVDENLYEKGSKISVQGNPGTLEKSGYIPFCLLIQNICYYLLFCLINWNKRSQLNVIGFFRWTFWWRRGDTCFHCFQWCWLCLELHTEFPGVLWKPYYSFQLPS